MASTRSIFIVIGVLFALLAAPGSAIAETPAQIAEARFKNGLKLMERDNYEEARVELLQALAIYPRSSILRNLALCELKTNRPLEALAHLRTYLADPSIPNRDDAKKNFDDAFARTGHIAVQAAEGAALTVDGAAVGNAPFKDALDVTTGKHVLEARFGANKLRREVDALPGVVVHADLRFDEAPASPPPDESRVQDTAPPPVTPDSRTPGWLVPASVGLGAAFIVGMGVGVTFLGAQKRSIEDADRIVMSTPGGNPCVNAASDGCRARDHKLLDARTYGTASDVGFIAGALCGAGAAAALAVLLWPRSSTSTTTATTITPLLNAETAGFHFSQSF